MARTVKEQDYAERRKQILDIALRLVYTKGFGQMTIQDILDELGISKGAFYHYFDSKGAVLEALVERIVDELEPLLNAIVQDPRLSALEKLQRYFDTASRWKTARKPLMLELLRVWYADENAIVRQKVFTATVERITPMFAQIIRLGVQEGVFTTPYPEYTSQLIINHFQGLGDTFAALLLSGEPKKDALGQVETAVAAYTDALERVLGAPRGSIQLMDKETMKAWFASPEDTGRFPDGTVAETLEVVEPRA